MRAWPRHPVIYEINTRVWLSDLSRKYRKVVDLATVPEHEWDAIAMAEAYWDLEWELQQQGFDYCYDKKLYDRMEHGGAESVRQHLLADSSYQEGMVRFIENHDEPRAAATFSFGKGRAAAVAILTLLGQLIHGNREGTT